MFDIVTGTVTESKPIRFLLSCLIYKISKGDFNNEESPCWVLTIDGLEAHYLKLLHNRKVDLHLVKALFAQTVKSPVCDAVIEETIFEQLCYGGMGFAPWSGGPESYDLTVRKDFIVRVRCASDIEGVLDQILGWPQGASSIFFRYMYTEPRPASIKTLQQKLGIGDWLVALPPELARLQVHYSWRALKAKAELPQPALPNPFCFIGHNKESVPANRSEQSFIKELLDKAAGAGIENQFQFSLSKNREIVVKYQNKLLGRVFLGGRKHKMEFKVKQDTYILENLSLTECKKLLLIWIGQIKIPVKVIDLMDRVPITGDGYSIKFLGYLNDYKVYLQYPHRWQGCVGYPTFVLVDKDGNAQYATHDETMQCMRFER